MANIHVGLTSIKHKIFIALIYCIVCEMHISIFQIFLLWLLVNLCCKSRQTLLIDIDPHWIATINKYIDTHIEFQAIY